MKRRPSADETALLLEFLRRQREIDVGRPTNRYLLSRKTVQVVSARTSLREAFLGELESSMAELGWILFAHADFFAVVQMASVDSWPKISSARIADTLRKAHNSRKLFNYDELGIDLDDGDDDDLEEDKE